MSERLEKSLAEYAAVAVPLGFRHDLSRHSEWGSQQDEFFGAMAASLHLGEHASRLLFVRDRMIVPIEMSTLGPARTSDDYLTELQFDNAQTLGSVLRTRDDLNYETVQFAKYDLQRQAVSRLADIYEDLNPGL